MPYEGFICVFEKTIEAIYKVSKKDSKLLIGWNVNKSIDPILSKITNNLFKHKHWAGLSKRIVMNNTTHVFDFFINISKLFSKHATEKKFQLVFTSKNNKNKPTSN